MVALELPRRSPDQDPDNRVILRGFNWMMFEILLAARGERSAPRMTYLNGSLEIISPSSSHEEIKTRIARLLEIFAFTRRLPLNGYGSWTLKHQGKDRGIEPDECYVLGDRRDVPDLAIEVIWTSGGLDKLEIYRGLGVKEVWVWRDDVIEVFALRGDTYEVVPQTTIIPGMDVKVLARFIEEPNQTKAAREFLAALGVKL